jgi:hypothetical protein
MTLFQKERAAMFTPPEISPKSVELTGREPAGSIKQSKEKARRMFKALGVIPNYPKKSLDMQLCTELYCRTMDAKEYHALKDQAMNEYKERIKAIETVWAMSNKQNPPPEPPSTSELIKRALPSFGGKLFTVSEMKEAIETMYPETKGRIRITSLSGTFTRMAKRGDAIRVQRKGSGTTAAVYMRVPGKVEDLK